LIAEMLSLSGGERFPPLDLSPQRKKERTLAALLRQLQTLARRQPVLMIFEDLHWIDPTSRELLDLTVEKITELPVLLVATYRPEFQPPWVRQSQITVIALNRLGRSEGARHRVEPPFFTIGHSSLSSMEYEIGTSRRRNTQVRLTHRWREMDSNY
jgi:predicted ATPase